jgi:3-methyladenine DNA glycosylase/8-oxoguanine DNA glycosylase
MTDGTLHTFPLELVGPGGEPVDLWRTFVSHGVAALPPMRLDEAARVFEITVPTGAGARTARVAAGAPGQAAVAILGPPLSAAAAAEALATVRHVLRLDEDLAPFYALAAADPDLAWAVAGAGRMVRSATVFEEVVKTVCTTNCAWSATVRMVGALVEHLGEPAPDAPPEGAAGRTFPTAAAMAGADEEFYRDVVRAGYRGRYLRDLAEAVAAERLDLEDLDRAGPDDLPDEEVARRLLALPGVGPYAAAHVMLMLGRYSRLVLDSWTRPTYARLMGAPTPIPDAAIEARFRPYGRYAGLAFWLAVTRDWVAEEADRPPSGATALPAPRPGDGCQG